MTDSVDVKAGLVTPEQADEWLKKNHFERQRNRRPRHVAFLASEMAKGTFRKYTQIEFGVFNGHAYLVNGQHTLEALVSYGKPVELVVIRQAVADEEGLARLYNTYDSGLSRTWVDAYAAMNLSNRYDMADQEVNAYGRAAPYISGNFTYHGVRDSLASKSKDQRLSIMEAYHPAAKLYLTCLEQAEPPIRRALMLPPLLALGTFTISSDPERATTFWTLAADDQNLTKTDPPKVATMLAQRVDNKRQRTMIGLAQSAIVAWNAYVLDKEIKAPRLIRSPTDIVQILATPLAEQTPATEPVQDDGLDAARELFGEIDDMDDGDENQVPPRRPSAAPEARV